MNPSLNCTSANQSKGIKLELATLGGGCFWCTEAVFLELKGVESVEPGFSGGSKADPSYEDVCAGDTGHAEVVQIKFDPHVIAYADLLKVFFAIHDPTTLNRQGNDIGTQYRSVIFYHDENQKNTAERVKREVDAEGIWRGSLVTEIAQFVKFYPAEEYHKNYFRNNPRQGYCQIVIAPKVAKFRKQYITMLKK